MIAISGTHSISKKEECHVLACDYFLVDPRIRIAERRAIQGRKNHAYRGRRARIMSKKFAEYGLPSWPMWGTGFLEVTLWVTLIIGLWFRSVTGPAAAVLALSLFVAISQ